MTLSTCESCTAGKLSEIITRVPGSSLYYKGGLIAYSNEIKNKVVNIDRKKIDKYGAVSKQICNDMVKNVGRIGKTNMSVAITGVAGPSGGTRKKPVGLVYVGIKKGNKVKIEKYLFKNKGRSYIQKSAVNKTLKLILSFLK